MNAIPAALAICGLLVGACIAQVVVVRRHPEWVWGSKDGNR